MMVGLQEFDVIGQPLQHDDERKAQAPRGTPTPTTAVIRSSPLVLQTLLLRLPHVNVPPNGASATETRATSTAHAERAVPQCHLPIWTLKEVLVGLSLHVAQWTGHDAIVLPGQHQGNVVLCAPEAVAKEEVTELLQRVLSHSEILHRSLPLLALGDRPTKLRLERRLLHVLVRSDYVQQRPHITRVILQWRARQAQLAHTVQRHHGSVQLALWVFRLVDLVHHDAAPSPGADHISSDIFLGTGQAAAGDEHVGEPRVHALQHPLPHLASAPGQHLHGKRSPTPQFLLPVRHQRWRAEHEDGARQRAPAFPLGVQALVTVQSSNKAACNLHRFPQAHLIREQTAAVLHEKSLVEPAHALPLVDSQACGNAFWQYEAVGHDQRPFAPPRTEALLWSQERRQRPLLQHTRRRQSGRRLRNGFPLSLLLWGARHRFLSATRRVRGPRHS
mmetsp:Transcript_35723/g.94947  ORF Transcript_35723/g.94947 Transcript_35723/m.94947 type:complete len:446 (-) Transcript_35723:87-1424(-)